MKLLRKVGATSQILQIFIQDSGSVIGAGLTGLTNASGSLTAYYHRDTDTTATAISLVSMTVGTFTSSGFKEIDATNMPGWYQFCPPNAALASGAASVGIHLKGATNMAPLPIEIDLDAQVDVTFWNGTVVATPATAGIPDINVKNIDNDAASASGTVTFPNATLASTTNITAATGVDITKILGTAISAPATAGILDVNVKNIDNDAASASGTVTFPNATLASTTNITAAAGIAVSSLGANVITAAATAADFGTEVAAAVWQDAVAGDFTVASSIGKALYVSNVAPGSAGGHFIAGTNAATTITTALTTTFTGNLTGSVASVTAGVTLAASAVQAIWDALTSALTTVGSIGKLLVTNIDAAISSRMATYTQPTGFLAATFPGTVASTTNITAGTITTATNLTNAPTAGDFTATMKTSLNAATPAVTVSDKTGFSLTSAYDPAKTASQAGDAMTLTAAYDAAKVAASATTAAAIKTQTDKLTFTVANKVDAGIYHVNGTTVTGTGASGDEWGPA